ncbi:hypothetical protein CENSYa_0718 [Cenarchaeum symbiosum A]|uniref:Uncharacterized protein n=1 Tax=Cenarchaeum symbiosum (strain A) TaxID=414004 RepID=A0RVI4_CENSY|nr:hypothetical protein CENSYa_0718 [Cenarchaeum symbiosum A]
MFLNRLPARLRRHAEELMENHGTGIYFFDLSILPNPPVALQGDRPAGVGKACRLEAGGPPCAARESSHIRSDENDSNTNGCQDRQAPKGKKDTPRGGQADRAQAGAPMR